jgi:ABC-type Co2+ transport system permease subunit
LSVLFRNVGNGRKRSRISHGKISQHLPINHNAGCFESLDEAAVRNTVQARSRIDPDNPKTSHVAFAHTTVSVCILQRVHERLMGTLVKSIIGGVMPFNLGKYFAVSAVSRNAALYTGHKSLMSPTLNCFVRASTIEPIAH